MTVAFVSSFLQLEEAGEAEEDLVVGRRGEEVEAAVEGRGKVSTS